MRKNKLIKIISELGWYFSREGTKHEIWVHKNAVSFIPIPRGHVIQSRLAKHIQILAKKYIMNHEINLLRLQVHR